MAYHSIIKKIVFLSIAHGNQIPFVESIINMVRFGKVKSLPVSLSYNKGSVAIPQQEHARPI